MMRRRTLVVAAAAALAGGRAAAQSGPGPARARLGWLTAQGEASLRPFVQAFVDGLAALGWEAGRNLSIQFRYGDDDIGRVPALADDLERQVDVIVAQGAAVYRLSQLGLKVPVVYVYSGDPVLAGFARSYARPGGNMSGLTFMAAELNTKRIEILRELVPSLSRLAILANPEHPGETRERAVSEATASRLGLALRYEPVRTLPELDAAFARLRSEAPQGISVFSDGFAVQNRQRIVDFGLERRAPVISGWPVFAEAGAVCTYGPRLLDSYRRLAAYTDRVLRGARVGDLPIELPTTFETVVNLKTAALLGLRVPESLLLRADRVIR